MTAQPATAPKRYPALPPPRRKCGVPEHRDVNYHWYNRVRIHIPVITNSNVLFYCGDTHVHMEAGEAWIFDSWKKHRVENNSDQSRVHLVVDTAGSAKFWKDVAAPEWRDATQVLKPASISDQYIPFERDNDAVILTENYNAPLVMHPGEIAARAPGARQQPRLCGTYFRRARPYGRSVGIPCGAICSRLAVLSFIFRRPSFTGQDRAF